MIRIINGSFGWNDNGIIRPLTKDSGLIDFLPKETEKRLVEEVGIAEYVDASMKANAEEFELGNRQVEELDYSELQKAYRFYGLGSPVSKKKDELIAAIKEHLELNGDVETEEVGEVNEVNLVPEKKAKGKRGRKKASAKKSEESEDDADDESAPDLNGVDGVAD